MLSCAQLSRNIDKSLPLTTKMLNGQIKDGLVVETGYATSTGGRRPVMYSLKPDMLYVVSVAMDQFVTRIAVMDMQNQFITPVETLELPLLKNPEALTVLTAAIAGAINRSGLPKDKIAGVGIGMPGFVDLKEGVNHSFFNADGKNIRTLIGNTVGLPVFIDNDSSLIALAELKFGAARGKRDVMVINIGWGIGLGMLLNGNMFRGSNGLGGEFSHIPMFNNDKLCSCGKMGCMETETSLLVMVEQAIDGLKQGRQSALKDLKIDHVEEATAAIINAALKGDKFAVELLSGIGYNIGRGAAILIHLFNPELIVLSGRGSLAGKLWLAPVQQAINEHCIPKIAEKTAIKVSTLGYQAEIIGAAALVMEHYDT
ncbi:ROK family protein [Mucilaginibacter sp. HMF7410]|uniref:ROK family protein n=2 Tax=Mucilaginibacter arboris TaxID=2682090 RepID=A0A7K1ST64_9SPHI|nr:ROK family protein [Mucilaginibacter arboris]